MFNICFSKEDTECIYTNYVKIRYIGLKEYYREGVWQINKPMLNLCFHFDAEVEQYSSDTGRTIAGLLLSFVLPDKQIGANLL